MSKSARTRYAGDNRKIERKRRHVLKSSHGKWTYEALMKHQQEIESKRPRKAVKKR